MRGRIEEEIVRYCGFSQAGGQRDGGEASRIACRCDRRRSGLPRSAATAGAAKADLSGRSAAGSAPGVDDLVQDRQPARVGGDDVIKTVKRKSRSWPQRPVLVRERQEVQEVPGA
jgi:hypothetical protein